MDTSIKSISRPPVNKFIEPNPIKSKPKSKSRTLRRNVARSVRSKKKKHE